MMMSNLIRNVLIIQISLKYFEEKKKNVPQKKCNSFQEFVSIPLGQYEMNYVPWCGACATVTYYVCVWFYFAVVRIRIATGNKPNRQISYDLNCIFVIKNTMVSGEFDTIDFFLSLNNFG